MVQKLEFSRWTLLNNCVVKTQALQTFTLLYLTPPVYLGLWFWIRTPKLKREEAGSLSKSEPQKLHRLYTQGGAAYGSARTLVKASNLSVSNVRQFLHSNPSYTKFILATRNFKHMKAIARFKNENWCMNLAYVDELSKDNNGVKYLLVRQDLFDRTVDAKGLKTKDSKKTVRAFLTMITKKKRSKKFGLTREQSLLEILRKYAKLKEYKFTLPLHGRQWIQVLSQNDSICYNNEF